MPKKREEGEAPRAGVGERAIIRLIEERFMCANSQVIVGLGDDAAVLRQTGAAGAAAGTGPADLIATSDLLVEGVHFRLDWMSLADAGYKALAANISDIAAMGGLPRYALGAVGVPHGTSGAEIEALLDGVAEAAGPCGVALIGGDTVAAPQWILGFTVLGETTGRALKRSGASPGDNLWHSGALGLSETGLHVLCGGLDPARFPASVSAHRRPSPQVALGQWLQREGLASACLDTSDSLAQCALLLAEASGVGLRLDFTGYAFDEEVARFAAAQRNHMAQEAALTVAGTLDPQGKSRSYQSLAEYVLGSSEDFQLLFTAAPAATPALLRYGASNNPGTSLTKLGMIVDAAEGCHYLDELGQEQPLKPIGFQHLTEE